MERTDRIGLSFLADQFFFLQKRRIASELRLLQLEKQQRSDPVTQESYQIFLEAEKRLQLVLERAVENYEVWNSWLSKVKGMGKLLAAEIIGGFESGFRKGEGIEHFRSVSQMWAFAGLNVEGGKAPRRTAGQRLTFNAQLRTVLLGRVATCLLMKGGKYWEFYDLWKEKYVQRFNREGVKIIPSEDLPTLRGKKYEPDKVISQGHLHNMARRKMIKLFVAHLYEEWRRAEGLGDDRRAYVLDILGHQDYLAPFEDKS